MLEAAGRAATASAGISEAEADVVAAAAVAAAGATIAVAVAEITIAVPTRWVAAELTDHLAALLNIAVAECWIVTESAGAAELTLVRGHPVAARNLRGITRRIAARSRCGCRFPDEADFSLFLLALLLTLGLISRALGSLLAELVMDLLGFDAHRRDPLLELRFFFDDVDGVQTVEDGRSLRVLAVGLADRAHQACALLMIKLVHVCDGELGHQRCEPSLERRPRLADFPLENLEP